MSKVADRIAVSLPADVKYISVARLVTAGAAARADLSIEATEDLKVAVSEACTNVMEHAFGDDVERGAQNIKLAFYVSDKELTVEVEDEGCGFDPKHLPPVAEKPFTEGTGLGLYLIRELMDEVKIESAPGSGTKIVMTKRSAR